MTKHSHYHKDVTHLKSIDVYRTLELFGVTDQALGHAIKKLLCAGQRGAGKTFEQDVREAVDTLNRRLQMLAEDDAPKPVPPAAAPEGKCRVVAGCGEVAVKYGACAAHQQKENEATHRDGGGSKFKQDSTGRWLQWGLDSWFYHSDNPKAVPGGLKKLALLPAAPAQQVDEAAPAAATHWQKDYRRWVAQDSEGGYSEWFREAWFSVKPDQVTEKWLRGLHSIDA